MNILAIETSCDETAAAIVKDGRFVLSTIVASQAQLHARYGGVVPEVAARKHVESIVPVIDRALHQASCDQERIDMIAVTVGPGLVSSLLIGVDAARSLAYGWGKKVIPVNHMLGHVYANQILKLQRRKIQGASDFTFPSICLTVSGGHTDLILIKSHKKFELLGSTLDDAAGEAFDKVASLLGLGYPGGPVVSKMAQKSSRSLRLSRQYRLPSPLIDQNNFDFSFSGLKTAVRNLVEQQKGRQGQGRNKKKEPLSTKDVQLICSEFERVVVKVLLHKTFKAVTRYKVKNVMLAGGVAANARLRSEFAREARKLGILFSYPLIQLCTDNAAMIGAAAFFQKNKAMLPDKIRVDLRSSII